MKINVRELSYEAEWYEFGDARLKIKPYLFSSTDMVFRDGGVVISGKQHCKMFKDCLIDWENVADADGKDLPCTDEIKQKIFDARLAGIHDFVLTKCWEFAEAKGDQEKN
ncbi:hypothetical protein KKE60_07725 [Patescibacteria group bacterium]|nr:hypothetical protein [Patescibacteria group bacterium]